MEKIKKVLRDLGLNEKEAAIWLTLARLGPSPVATIARTSGITRTLVYSIAESLEGQGLITEVEAGGKRRYEAIDHAGLLATVARRQRTLSTLEKDLGQAASEFAGLRVGAKLRTKARFFEGPEGIHSIYAEIKSDLKKQKEPSELLTVFSPGLVERTLPGWFEAQEYIEVPSTMSKRGILYDSPVARQYLEKIKDSASKHHYKMWPSERGEFPVDTLCWLNKLTLIDLVDYPSGIVIENAAIVQVFTMWFELMWESLS